MCRLCNIYVLYVLNCNFIPQKKKTTLYFAIINKCIVILFAWFLFTPILIQPGIYISVYSVCEDKINIISKPMKYVNVFHLLVLCILFRNFGGKQLPLNQVHTYMNLYIKKFSQLINANYCTF